MAGVARRVSAQVDAERTLARMAALQGTSTHRNDAITRPHLVNAW
ncbi:hypothetical protein ABZ793_14420 [Micromonospora sp. NPDC047465]